MVKIKNCGNLKQCWPNLKQKHWSSNQQQVCCKKQKRCWMHFRYSMMSYKFFVYTIVCFIKMITCFSQDTNDYKRWNPADNSFPVIEGQAWPNEVKEKYDRFPARAEKTLNHNVWNISHSSAGLYIKFKTNA